jgi:hypothetical protein
VSHGPSRRVAVCVLGHLLACSAAAIVPGGGPAAIDCAVVFDGVTATRGRTLVSCHDGDPACDADGVADGACTFGVNLCVLASAPAGCAATAVASIDPPAALLATSDVVRTALVPPATPASAPACGSAALVRLALRGRSRPKPSKRFRLRTRATATVGGRIRRDVDHLVLECVPGAGVGECPANPAGGPRELTLVAADAGTDLDNGWIGVAHNFPIVGGSTLRTCLTGCDPSTTSQCGVTADTGAGTRNPAFGPPLPLFVVGSATCLVNRYDGPIAGTADLATGAIDLSLTLSTEVWVAPPSVVCPQCSGSAFGDTGVCLAGPDQGRACRVEGTVLVSDAGNKVFRLSSSCRPDGTLAARLRIPLHVTTGTRVLDGPLPCTGQLETNGCATAADCTAVCTGNACVGQAPNPVNPAVSVCVDRKGGLSQLCCADDPTRPCFPSDRIERTGRATAPAPAWPEPSYPKTGEPVLVDAFCEPATGSNLLDALTTGLPGASALILPMRACFRDGQPCP